jgi:hypothetical protein
MAFLREFLGDRITSKDLRPPRSPGFSPPDFLLWGYLKRVDYISKFIHNGGPWRINPDTVEELMRKSEVLVKMYKC